jgi:hypothetical protein
MRTLKLGLVVLLVIVSAILFVLSSDSMSARLLTAIFGAEKSLCIGTTRFNIGKDWNIEWVWRGRGTMPLFKGLVPLPIDFCQKARLSGKFHLNTQ